MRKRTSSSGGAGMHLGSEYQVRVAAWLAVEMLREGQGRPISPGGRISLLRGETQESVDDLLVGTATERYGLIQAKRKVSYSEKLNTEFRSVIDQAVRQIAISASGNGSRPWSRQLTPSNDRLLLITTSLSGSNINVLFRDVLNRAASLAPGQPLSDAAVTEAEEKILKGTVAAVTACWASATGHAPTDAEVLSVLSLLSVEILDVEPGHPGEREAMRTLSSVIIEDANQEGAAWASVLNACRKMMTERSGLDLVSLRRQLLGDGIALRAVDSYRKDIKRLQTHTASSIRSLQDLSQIIVDGKPVHIDRAAVHELDIAAEQESYLVTGHPGAGKSGALHDLIEVLRTKGDVVCLAADRLDIASLPALRTELGLDHDLADVFANWSGSRPGFLLIDALDAARGTRAADALLALMREVVQSKSRWRVVACIRKFDLRYSRDLQELFPRTMRNPVDSCFVDPDFPFVRHVNVPLLSEEELCQLKTSAPSLHNLYEGSSSAFRQLLHVPFNLRLAATLLQTGMRTEEFALIQTQIDLLDRYWERRVVGATGGDDRESVLRQALSTMVSKRRLQVDRAATTGPGLASALDQLVSSHVLTEWQPSPSVAPDRLSLAFEHNFLFDFALAKLHLPRKNGDLVSMLESDPDAVIVLRPSIALRLQELWATSRQRFWELAFAFAKSSKISLIAQITPMITVAENARAIDDLSPLIDALEVPNPQDAKAAGKALRHLIGVLKSERREDGPYTGFEAGPWCELLERITRDAKPELSGACQALIEDILMSKHELDASQLSLLGLSARRVLDMAWQAPHRNGQMIIHALRTVCATFSSDPAESAMRIRRALEPERVREFGYEELHWLAHEVKNLISLDPELVADIFIATFDWTETDESATPITDSQIIPMISNRRQDHNNTRWHLTQHYAKLVKRFPAAAARAMVAIVSAYRRDNDIANDELVKEIRKDLPKNSVDEAVEALLDEEEPSRDGKLQTFCVDGVEVSLKEDSSSTWENSHDEPVQILRSFFQQLDLWAGLEGTHELALLTIRLVMRLNQQAMVWRQLLGLLAKHPHLAKQLKSLADAKPLMLAPELKDEFGRFLGTLYSALSIDERGSLEDSILAISERGEGYEREIWQTRGDALLAALGDVELVREAARSRVVSLKARASIDAQNTPDASGFFQLSPDAIESMHKRGETPEERSARERAKPFIEPVEQFGSRFINGMPSMEEAEAMLSAMQESVALLERTDESKLPEKIADSVIASLAGACAHIAMITSLDCETDLGKMVKKVLLLAASNRYPEYRSDELKQFDKGPGGGWPIARIAATEGLMALAAGPDCNDPAIIETLEALAKDLSATVRYPIAHYATWIIKTHPEKMWEWIEALASDESITVREACVQTFEKLARVDAPRSLTLMGQILEDIPRDREGSDRLARTTVQELTGWYVWRNEPAAKAVIEQITSNILERASQAGKIPFVLREPLTHGSMEDSGEPAAIRHRAVEVLKSLSTQSCMMMGSAFENRNQVQPSSPHEDSALQSLFKLTDVIAGEVYFAAGAHQLGRESLPAIITRPEQTRFYWEAESVFDDLSSVGAPSLAHHLMETLEMYIDTDPRGVFLRMAATIRAGKPWEYQYEQLAQDVVLRVVRRYLADKRALLQNDEDCQRVLREILETFIEAGWPAAQQLAYRIDDIHR